MIIIVMDIKIKEEFIQMNYLFIKKQIIMIIKLKEIIKK